LIRGYCDPNGYQLPITKVGWLKCCLDAYKR